MPEIITNEPCPQVYLIHDAESGHYKVGCTSHMEARFRALRKQRPGIKHIHSIRTNDQLQLEKYWHFEFRHKHQGEEWFDLNETEIDHFCAERHMNMSSLKRRPVTFQVDTELNRKIDAYCFHNKISKQDLIYDAFNVFFDLVETCKE